MLIPKPLPFVPAPRPLPKIKRLHKRPHPMTLVAAFRCRNGGILLCADREENGGYAEEKSRKYTVLTGCPHVKFFSPERAWKHHTAGE